MPRRYVVNRSSARRSAEQIREAFMAKPPERVTDMGWQWPKKLVEVGEVLAVMYRSDKWSGVDTDYKHVSEGPQVFATTKAFLRDFDEDASGRKRLTVCGPTVEINGPMPDSFAVLAHLLGLQIRLYEEDEDGEFYLPNGDDAVYQVDLQGLMLGAAKHPKSKETFLIVYDRSRVYGLITGDVLDVERDGIVG